jgi:hypothetical protein
MALCLSGCNPPISNPKEVAGEYVFTYQTGEIEVLNLSADLTYRQEFYKDAEAYRIYAKPLYTNRNVWVYTRNIVTMTNWLVFCDYPDPKRRIEPPKPYSFMCGMWFPHDIFGDAYIVFAVDLGYTLMRVESRKEMKSIGK